jgi:Ca2+-binding EF-hand superfamily protein
MGNSSSGPRMAISAMADMLSVTKPQMMELRNACLRHAKPSLDKSNAGPTISQSSFHKSMKEVNVDPVVFDVFDHLYTMWDTKGEGEISMLLFLAGISPLASTVDVMTKLLFAFELFDVHRTGRMKIEDALSILGGINATASYFGDAVITPQAIEIVIEDVFQGQNEIVYIENLEHISNHPAVVQFSLAAGTMRYGGASKIGR